MHELTEILQPGQVQKLFAAGFEIVRRPDIQVTLTVDDAVEAACGVFAVSETDLRSASRQKNIARARLVAMAISGKFYSASHVGRRFDRDHSTVISAVKRVDELMETDAVFEFQVCQVLQRARERAASRAGLKVVRHG